MRVKGKLSYGSYHHLQHVEHRWNIALVKLANGLRSLDLIDIITGHSSNKKSPVVFKYLQV